MVAPVLSENSMAARNYAPRRNARTRTPRVDECFERFADTAGKIASTLAAHNERIEAQDTVSERIQEDIRDMRRQQATDTATLHSRIDAVRDDLTKRLDEQTDKLTETITTGLDKVTSARVTDQKRIGALEKWRWIIGGGAAIVGFVIFDVLVRIFYQPIAQWFLRNMK